MQGSMDSSSMLAAGLHSVMNVHVKLQAVMGALCGASEYDELPVRHNEDQFNLGLSREVKLLPCLARVEYYSRIF